MLCKKINMLVVARWPGGGIRTYMRYVYNNFSTHKYSITLIAPNISEINILLKDLCSHNIRYIPMAEKPTNYDITKLVYETLRKYKYNIIHSHGLTAGICSILPSKVYNVPHLLTTHDVLDSNQFTGIQGYTKKMILSLSIPLIDKIHTVSYDAKENLLKYLPILKHYKNKTVAILNGIEIERFKNPNKTNLKEKLNIGDDVFLIGYLGRFMSQKGFVYLVEALDILYKHYKMRSKPVLLAFGEGGYIREEQNNVILKGLANVVHFMPFTPNTAPVLKGLDVVVMPSISEACGLLAMEAMVVGTPLIGTDCIGIREVLEDTPCKMVPAKNSEALAYAIAQEIQNPSTIQAEQFCDEAMLRFDVRKHCLQLEEIILNMISNKSM